VQGPIELTLEASERDVEQESAKCNIFLLDWLWTHGHAEAKIRIQS